MQFEKQCQISIIFKKSDSTSYPTILVILYLLGFIWYHNVSIQDSSRNHKEAEEETIPDGRAQLNECEVGCDRFH